MNPVNNPATPASKQPEGTLYNHEFLKKLSLKVKTVIDVGVRFGTPALYKAFPEAMFILVDPQKSGEALLKAIPERYIRTYAYRPS